MSTAATLDSILKKYLPEKQLQFATKLLFGPQEIRTLTVPPAVNGFEVKAFTFCDEDSNSKKVRVALFQNRILENPCAPTSTQRDSLLELGRSAIETAGLFGVNIFCFQEIWNMPVAFCTQKKLPWTEFGENAYTGPTTMYLKNLAQQHRMVIISPILERDERDFLWNTAVIINKDGNVLGISRKNHIPISGRYSEAYYYNGSDIGHPVFQTDFGRIAVAICYDRHHPQCFFAYGLNEAQIVFNPSATVQTFSEHIWPIEARDAAFQNGFYTCAINRVGSERFVSEGITAGPFFGSSYITCPDGSRTPGLSVDQNGLLIADLDLKKCSNKSTQAMTKGLKIF